MENLRYEEASQELVRALKRYIYESNERMNELEKRLDCLYNIDESILEARHSLHQEVVKNDRERRASSGT